MHLRSTNFVLYATRVHIHVLYTCEARLWSCNLFVITTGHKTGQDSESLAESPIWRPELRQLGDDTRKRFGICAS